MRAWSAHAGVIAAAIVLLASGAHAGGSKTAPDALAPPRAAAPSASPDERRARESAWPRLDLPEPPAVVVTVPRAAAGVAPELGLPPPELPVVLDPSALLDLPAVLAGRLAKGEVLHHARLGKRERDEIAAFYAKRGNRKAWIDGEAFSPAARAIIGRLEKSDEDALDSNDYPIPSVAVLPKDNREAALADADIKLSVAVAAYARDARGARIDPARLSKLVTPKLDLPSPADALDAVLAAADAGIALAAYNPRQPGYVALKAKLAAVRAARPAVPQVKVPAGPILRVGMRDPRVPLVRIRFGLGPDEDTTYDERVAAAVAGFQRENGLAVNGVLNRQTTLALAYAGLDSRQSEGDIAANMERWRWLPTDLGREYIMVNIPEFMLRLVRDGAVTHQARVITGKPDTPTPVFSHVMQHVIVNPYWHIPPSILTNEFLPKMAEDPDYAVKHGYEVVREGDKIVALRQPPGERNALGFIKFMFPNQHSVYLHDTPTRNLFGNERRAFSHGCVRLDQPFRFAELILGKDNGWSEQRVKSLIGHGERLISLKRPIPIHLTYFTAAVDEAGRLVMRDDLYGYNRRIREALGYPR